MKRQRVGKASENSIEAQKFQLAADKTSDQVIITSPGGTIIYANPAAEQFTGYSKRELYGQTVESLNLWGGWMGRYFYWDLWQTVKKKKRKFTAEIINRRKNNAKYITRLRVYPVRGERGKIKYIVGLEKNITAIKEIDDTKTEFIALASHQLRSPLNNISLAIDVLLRDPESELNEYQKDCLRGVYRNVHDMAGLITALLDVSKIKLGEFVAELKLVNIIDTAECALNQLMPEIHGKDLKLIKKYGHDIPLVMSDKNIINTILHNVLLNAVKYTPPGGVIRFNMKKEGDNILFKVTDSGWGIPALEQNKIFSKYFRAGNIKTKEAGGTGLGLYLTKMLLKSIQGQIWFSSRENGGTSFYITIPISEHAPAS